MTPLPSPPVTFLLVPTEAEAKVILTNLLRTALTVDAVVVCMRQEFAEAVAAAVPATVKVSHGKLVWRRGAAEATFLVGPWEDRICGHRHGVTVVVAEGYESVPVYVP